MPQTYLAPICAPLRISEARIRGGVDVSGFCVAEGRVSGVLTNEGRAQAGNVVIAAGAWSRGLGELVGLQVPVWPVRHQLCVTEPIAGVEELQPTVRIIDAKTYSRPAGAGLLFGAYESDPLDVDIRGAPMGFSIADLELDIAPLREKMESVRDLLPLLPSASIASRRPPHDYA